MISQGMLQVKFHTYIPSYIDQLFRNLLALVFPLEEASVDCSTYSHLTYSEENGLRYAAGYITRKLITQLQRSSHLFKDELLACLQALSEDLGEMKDESDDWIDAVD